MQVMATRRKLKFSRGHNHPRTVLHAKSRFSVTSEARYFKNIVVSGLAPPDVLNTSGVKKVFPFHKIRFSYLLHWARSCRW